MPSEHASLSSQPHIGVTADPPHLPESVRLELSLSETKVVKEVMGKIVLDVRDLFLLAHARRSVPVGIT